MDIMDIDEVEFFQLIRTSRLEKLLEDLYHLDEQDKLLQPELHFIAMRAKTVDSSLKSDFETDFAKLHHLRALDVQRLYLEELEMVLNNESKQSEWRAKVVETGAESKGMLGHKAGEWFIAPVAAYAAGLLSKPNGALCSCSFTTELTSLCLIDGFEKPSINDNTIEYVRQGDKTSISSMFTGHMGNTVRLFRGVGLKSRYAPKAGLRFDGIYRIHKYSLLLTPSIDMSADIWTAKITLIRMEGPNAEDLIHIPTPSQIDDYACFKQIEKREITRLVGSSAYQNWKASEESKVANSIPFVAAADKAAARPGISVFGKGKGKPFK